MTTPGPIVQTITQQGDERRDWEDQLVFEAQNEATSITIWGVVHTSGVKSEVVTNFKQEFSFARRNEVLTSKVIELLFVLIVSYLFFFSYQGLC